MDLEFDEEFLLPILFYFFHFCPITKIVLNLSKLRYETAARTFSQHDISTFAEAMRAVKDYNN